MGEVRRKKIFALENHYQPKTTTLSDLVLDPEEWIDGTL